MDDSDDEEDGEGEGHHQTDLYEEKSATMSTLTPSSVMDPAILTDIGDAVGVDFLVRLLTTVHGIIYLDLYDIFYVVYIVIVCLRLYYYPTYTSIVSSISGDLASVSLQLGLDIIATLCAVPCLTKRFFSIETLILQRMLESYVGDTVFLGFQMHVVLFTIF